MVLSLIRRATPKFWRDGTMKRVLCLVLALTMLFSLCGCGGGGDTSGTMSPSPNTEAPAPKNEAGSNINTVGDINVESGLFDVVLTIPADFVEEDMTQEELDQVAEEGGYQSATLNADGSVTYVMTKAQHNEMMEGIRQSIDESLSSMENSDDYPGIVSVSANDDYTKFTVTMSTDEVGLEASFAVMMFYISSGMYHVFNGTEAENVNVQYVKEATGEILQETNSNDMG